MEASFERLRLVALSGLLLAGCSGTSPAADAGPVFSSNGLCATGLDASCIDAVYQDVAAILAVDTNIFAQAGPTPPTRAQVEAALAAWGHVLGPAQGAGYQLSIIEEDLNLSDDAQEITDQYNRGFQFEVTGDTACGTLQDLLWALDSGDAGSTTFFDVLNYATPPVNFFLTDTYDVNYNFTPNYGVEELSHSLSLLFLAQTAAAPGIPMSRQSWTTLATQVSTLAGLVRSRAQVRCQQPPVSPICQEVSANELNVFAPALDALSVKMQSAAAYIPP